MHSMISIYRIWWFYSWIMLKVIAIHYWGHLLDQAQLLRVLSSSGGLCFCRSTRWLLPLSPWTWWILLTQVNSIVFTRLFYCLFTFVRWCDQHVLHYKICHVFVFPGRNLPNLKTRECLTDASFFRANHTAQKGRRWVNFGVLKQMKSYEAPWGLKVSCCHLLVEKLVAWSI